MSHWNHRVLAHDENNEMQFVIHEVYYDDEGELEGCTSNGIDLRADSIDGLRWTLKAMEECLAKPILWYGDKWPMEYVQQSNKIV